MKLSVLYHLQVIIQTIKQQHLEMRRERRCNFFDPKKFIIISCSLGLVFFSLTFMYTFTNPPRNAPLKPHPERINVILISLPRSGSTFLGEIFNHHPGVFYLFEPIGRVQTLFSRASILEFDFLSPTYQNIVLKFLRILTTASLQATSIVVLSARKTNVTVLR